MVFVYAAVEFGRNALLIRIRHRKGCLFLFKRVKTCQVRAMIRVFIDTVDQWTVFLLKVGRGFGYHWPKRKHTSRGFYRLGPPYTVLCLAEGRKTHAERSANKQMEIDVCGFLSVSSLSPTSKRLLLACDFSQECKHTRRTMEVSCRLSVYTISPPAVRTHCR